MRLSQYILTTLFGVLLAAILYFKIAMGHSQMFSHFAFDLAAGLGISGIPAIVVAINMRSWSIGSAVLSGVIAALMFFWFFIVSFTAGLPGNEWIDEGMLDGVLLLPALSVVVLAFRFTQAVPTLAVATLVVFTTISFGLPAYMRRALDQQISQTLARGGCVLAGRATKTKIVSADQVTLGWFIGSRSDQVFFVKGSDFYKWSYANFGLDTRRDVPRSFALTKEINCSAT